MSAHPAGRRRLGRGALAAIALLAAACDAPTYSRPEPAYDPTSLVAGQAYRWPSGSTVRVWVEAPASGGRDLSGAVDRAVVAWNAVPQFGEVRLTRAASRTLANVIVYDLLTPIPVRVPASCPFSPQGSVGYTWFCVNQGAPDVPLSARAQPLLLADGTATSATVVIRLDIGRTVSQSTLDAIVAHELGHALGIGGHSPNASDLMTNFPSVAVPSARDATTLRYVLGQRPVFFL
jgi:hypothetical protein